MIVKCETIHFGHDLRHTLFSEGNDLGSAEKALTVKIENRIEKLQVAAGFILLGSMVAIAGMALTAYLLLGIGVPGTLISVFVSAAVIIRQINLLFEQSVKWCDILRDRRQRTYGAVHVPFEFTW